MRLFEADLKRSKDWLNSMSSAYNAGATGEPTQLDVDMAGIEALTAGLDQQTINDLIAVLQAQIDADPDKEELERAERVDKYASKFVNFANTASDSMDSITNFFKGKANNPTKLFTTKEFKQLVWKLQHKKALVPADHRLIQDIVRKIPDTYNFKSVKKIITKLSKNEDLTDNEIEILKDISDSKDNDY